MSTAMASTDWRTTSVDQRPAGLLVPCLIVFASGFCIMAIELVASRLVSGYIGQSLYTWTTVIGVILAGITIGNYIGGRLADGFNTHRLAAVLFAVSAALSLTILWVVPWVGNATADWIGTDQKWATRIITVIFASFLLPGTALGTISPVIAKWALDRGFATGQTVGTIYAWNTIGSIAGTFFTGYFLVFQYEVSTIVVLSAAGLGIVALILFASSFLGSSAADPGRRVEPTMAGEAKGGGLLLPSLLVFTSGFCVMLVELVVSRWVSGHIGQSLYTWTSVIGVILAGISLGNYIGGKLADRFESKPLVGTLFLMSSILVLSTLQSEHLVSNATRSWLGMDTDWGARVFLVVFAAFFLPATALGTISPAVAKWALDRNLATGRTVGTIYAWNTLGSIAGTFATGFYLITTFYLCRLISISSVGLALIALLFVISSGPWTARILSVVWLGIASFIMLFAVMPADRFEETVLAIWPAHVDEADAEAGVEKERIERDRLRFASMLVSRNDEINVYDQYNFSDTFEYYDESNYYTIQVSEDTVDSNKLDDFEVDEKGKAVLDEDGNKVLKRRKMRQLVLDALIHGYMDMNDFSYLHYEYEHIYATVSHRILKKHETEGQDLRVLFLGGGSYTFPRYLTEIYKEKGIHCDVAEIDKKVTKTVMRSLGLNQLNRKKVVLLAPEPPAKSDDKKPASSEDSKDETADDEAVATKGWGTWIKDSAVALGAAFSPTPSDKERLVYYRKLVQQSGATQVEKVEKGVDYVFDVRPNKDEASPIIDEATKLNIPVIDAAKFEELLETTSHDNIVTTHMDARQHIMQSDQQGKYDVIYGDAFNDFSVPAHLTTVEFNAEMAKLLKPDGVFMANIIDIWQVSKFMGAYRNTLKQVFKHVYLLSTEDGEPGKSRSTFILICSQVPLELHDLGKRDEDLKGLVGTLMEGDLLAPVIRGGLKVMTHASFRGDASQDQFQLPRECHTASVMVDKNYLSDSEYTLDGKTLTLKQPPGVGSEIEVTLYTDQEIVLTDEYCPVDNMLAEVIATRMDNR